MKQFFLNYKNIIFILKLCWSALCFSIITTCANPLAYMWSPDALDTRQYFRYEETGGLCMGHCVHFFIYLFDDGEIIYYGEGINRRTGLRKKQTHKNLFLKVTNLLKKSRFNKLSNRYWYEDSSCGPEYMTDQGSLKFTIKSKLLNKTVDWDFGCYKTKDMPIIRKLSVEIKKILPIKNWVGKEHYEWDYDLKFDQ